MMHHNVLRQGIQYSHYSWSIPTAADDAIEKITGVRPAFMRPPYGNYNDLVKSVAQERGQYIVLWDMDSEDSVGMPDSGQQLLDSSVLQS